MEKLKQNFIEEIDEWNEKLVMEKVEI